MMHTVRLEDVEGLLKTGSHLDLCFDVSLVSNKGIVTPLVINAKLDDLQNFIANAIDEHDPEQVYVDVKRKQGNTYTSTQKFAVSAYEDASVIDDRPLPAKPSDTSNRSDMDKYYELIIRQLSEDKRQLQRQCASMALQQKTLNEQLLDKEKTIRILETDKELDQKRHQFALEEKENEKSGLSGVTDVLAANPQLANVAAVAMARLMGIDPVQVLPQAPIAGVEEDTTPRRIAKLAEQLPQDAQYKLYVFTQLAQQQPGMIAQVLEQFRQPPQQDEGM